jgi:hypothetical protein
MSIRIVFYFILFQFLWGESCCLHLLLKGKLMVLGGDRRYLLPLTWVPTTKLF